MRVTTGPVRNLRTQHLRHRATYLAALGTEFRVDGSLARYRNQRSTVIMLPSQLKNTVAVISELRSYRSLPSVYLISHQNVTASPNVIDLDSDSYSCFVTVIVKN